MLARVVLTVFLIMSLLVVSIKADEFGLDPKGYFDALPDDVVNVALPDFGKDFIIPGDYGLGNAIPVEKVHHGEKWQARIFRSPELRISHRRPAEMQVLLGNVQGLYVWIDTPPIQGEWLLLIDLVYVDGTRRQIFSKHMKPGVRNWIDVEPHTRVSCHLSTKTTAVKIPLRFVLTLSPVLYAVYPDSLPMPYRTIFD